LRQFNLLSLTVNVDEFPGHVETVDLNYRPISDPEPDLGFAPLDGPSETIIEKSNLMLLGPSGVGKTYILSTLAKILEVPFATVDCSSLTQAGYIGTDIESAIERLLLASNHNVAKCETGIIFFDELDKLAKPAVMTHGRDVSGEGVQQGLLKMIEGTSVTVHAKSDRNSKSESNSRGSDRMSRDSSSSAPPGKSEQYTIDTSNILFVFAGAFVGLSKIISSRLSSGTSLGFGAQLKKDGSIQGKEGGEIKEEDLLGYVTPTDLQTYGLIPELLGRIPILTSLHPLTLPQLVSILTEPKNSLVKQYTKLFHTSNIELRFTTRALKAIAEKALGTSAFTKDGNRSTVGGIGARGLRSIMESVLGEIMFWGPGSGIRYCLVDEKFVRGHDKGSSQFQTKKLHNVADKSESKSLMPRCWTRGQVKLFENAYELEEEGLKAQEVESFEQYREVGSSGM
jgi:ATP-dependent Clp protease ATP-binding subunit ClpX